MGRQGYICGKISVRIAEQEKFWPKSEQASQPWQGGKRIQNTLELALFDTS